MEEVIQASSVLLSFNDVPPEHPTSVVLFVEGQNCQQLSLSLRDTRVSVHMQGTHEGECVSYIYPRDAIARIKVVHK